MTLLLCAVSGAWADDVLLKSIDFTNTTNFPAATYGSTDNDTQQTVNGVFIYTKKGSKYIKINNTTPGVDFDAQNMDTSTGKHGIAIPVTGVNGSITVKVTHNYNNTSASFRVGIAHATDNDPSKTQTWDLSITNSGTKNKDDFQITKTGLSGTEYIVWVGESGSSYKVLKQVDIYTTASSGKSNPSLSVSPTTVTLAKNGTQQLTPSQSGDGAISYESSNENVATVTSGGLVTAVGYGSATITVTSAETEDYDEGIATMSVIVKENVTIQQYAQFDNGLTCSPEGFATIDGDINYNSNYTGTYNGKSYAKGLKMQSGNVINFATISASCDLVVVQSTSTNGGNNIKIDDTNFASDYDTKYSYDVTADKIRVYVIKGITAGSHTIKRASNEMGILYVGVTEAPTPTCATPVISPADGSIFGGYQSVTITCETGGAAIHYTTDGTTPTASSATYSSPFNITNTTTIKAIAVKADYDDSNVATAKLIKVNTAFDRSWDFGNWSAATKTGTIADMENWSNEEKSDASGLHFGDNGRSNIGSLTKNTLKYGSTNIEETNGLKFTSGAYGLGLIYNLASTELGTYHGSQYLWLYGNNSKIVIPDVLPGSTIGIGVESHNSENARGVTLSGGGATQIAGSATSMTYQDVTWRIPTGGEVTITPSKGLHIYYITIYKNSEIEPVSSFGWSTYITKTAASFAANTAYVVTEVDGSNIVTEAVTSVPANTPILLKGEGNKTITPLLSADAPATNLLSVSNGTANGTKIPYVLAKNGESAGFKKWTGDIAKLNGRVVLWLDSEIAARDFFDLDGEATGINKVVNNQVMDNQYYNLAGQRVAQPTKGLYIVNGKKVVIK